MRNLKTLLSVLALISTGGGGSTLLGAPSTDASPLVSLPHQAPGATSAAPQVIGLGEEVTGTISPAVFDLSTGTLSPAVDELFFELTAPSDGTLIVHLAWDPGLDLLGLQLEDVAFNYWPPTLGTLQVAAGQTYRLSVWANPWGLSSPVPFVLTTSILPGLVALPRGCETSPPVPDWICIDGGWVPPDHPLALGGVAPSAPPPSSAGVAPPAPPPSSVDATVCLTIRPGSDWVCVNGGWVSPDHPLAIASPPSSPSAPPTPAPAPPVVESFGCTTVQPAATWVCVNGGWLPPDHPLALPAPTNPTLATPVAAPAPPPPPVAAPAPPAPPPGSGLLWVMVLTDSGVCIEGATIQIVRAEGAGEPILQETPCDAWGYGGGVLLTDLTPGVELTLRGAASGYAPREMSFLPFPTPGSFQAVFITLSKGQ